MNEPQRLGWEQTRSDHAVLLILRRSGVAPCHQLHYLQMVTEKLAKAYLWRTNSPPRASHVGFVNFLKALDNRSKADRERIASQLEFPGTKVFEAWMQATLPIAYGLERLAPALAGNHGPNPEYPWPTARPAHPPASHEFAVWKDIQSTANGRRLLRVVEVAIERFPTYA